MHENNILINNLKQKQLLLLTKEKIKLNYPKLADHEEIVTFFAQTGYYIYKIISEEITSKDRTNDNSSAKMLISNDELIVYSYQEVEIIHDYIQILIEISELDSNEEPEDDQVLWEKTVEYFFKKKNDLTEEQTLNDVIQLRKLISLDQEVLLEILLKTRIISSSLKNCENSQNLLNFALNNKKIKTAEVLANFGWIPNLDALSSAFNSIPEEPNELPFLQLTKICLKFYPIDLAIQNGTLVHLASKHNKSTTLAYLLEQGGDFKQKDYDEHTALDCAIFGLATQSLEVLVKADPELQTLTLQYSERINAVCRAAEKDFSALKFFLEILKLTPDDVTDNQGQTLLHHAASGNNREAIDYLLSRNKDLLNRISKEQFSAIDNAIENRSIAALVTLKKRGAVLNSQHPKVLNEFFTAIKNGNPGLVAVFILEGINLNEARDPNTSDPATHFAVEHANLRILGDLLAHGARLGLLDKNNNTIFSLAANKVCDKSYDHSANAFGYFAIITLLLTHFKLNDLGIDISSIILKDIFFAAVHYSQQSLLEVLLEKGFDITAVSADGTNALFFACNDPKMFAWLIEQGVNPQINIHAEYCLFEHLQSVQPNSHILKAIVEIIFAKHFDKILALVPEVITNQSHQAEYYQSSFYIAARYIDNIELLATLFNIPKKIECDFLMELFSKVCRDATTPLEKIQFIYNKLPPENQQKALQRQLGDIISSKIFSKVSDINVLPINKALEEWVIENLTKDSLNFMIPLNGYTSYISPLIAYILSFNVSKVNTFIKKSPKIVAESFHKLYPACPNPFTALYALFYGVPVMKDSEYGYDCIKSALSVYDVDRANFLLILKILLENGANPVDYVLDLINNYRKGTRYRITIIDLILMDTKYNKDAELIYLFIKYAFIRTLEGREHKHDNKSGELQYIISRITQRLNNTDMITLLKAQFEDDLVNFTAAYPTKSKEELTWMMYKNFATTSNNAVENATVRATQRTDNDVISANNNSMNQI